MLENNIHLPETDNRNFILQKLNAYKPFDELEMGMKQKMINFVLSSERCFDRDYEPGHITGSAWVVNKDRTAALLTHHAKLNMWIQLGGHSDSDPNTLRVALREVDEESGLKSAKAVTEDIFDIDVHLIPARSDFPAHYHYDVRFLVEADQQEPFIVSEESKDLSWVELGKIPELNDKTEILRMVEKTQQL